ncbi:MAG: DoxX family membrane protein [Bacteroidia bacterium]|nr:DoxX family membrane protein [Bacteroidia bacterium]
MEIINQYQYEVAVLIARVFLGCLFLFQGYDAVFNIKIKNVIATFENDLIHKGIPRFLIVWGSWFTSYSELIGGTLLIVGLFNYPVLFMLGLNLIIAAIGFGINTPVWDTRHVFPRLALLLLLLIIPQNWNTFSIDHLIFKP